MANSKSFRKAQVGLSCLLASALLAGCQSMGSGGGLSPTADLPPPESRTWANQSEDVLNQRATVYGLIRAPELEKYLNGLYAKIKKQAGVPEWQGSVYLLGTSRLDAMATAAGNIYISPSWIQTVGSEDELVAILSHEFGHIYLHYHQLEEAKLGADQTAQIAALGLAIAQKTAQSQGWSNADTLMSAYLATRDLAVAAYSRSQESAADSFGLNISTKLGYSYEYGMKAFLEHMLSWEEQNEERDRLINEQLAQTLDGALQVGQKKIKKGWAYATGQHPDTIKRIDAMAISADALPMSVLSKKPVKKPLDAALKQPRTSQTLKAYANASKAFGNLQEAASVDYAKQGVAGPGAKLAFNVMALNDAVNANQQSGKTFKGIARSGSILDANLASEQDRAWIVYKTRANQLAESGQVAPAKTLMDQGFAYFRPAKEAWPDAIEFYGKYESWSKAKQLASECSSKYPVVAQACQLAAQTPDEKAQVDRASQQKANSLVGKIFGK